MIVSSSLGDRLITRKWCHSSLEFLLLNVINNKLNKLIESLLRFQGRMIFFCFLSTFVLRKPQEQFIFVKTADSTPGVLVLGCGFRKPRTESIYLAKESPRAESVWPKEKAVGSILTTMDMDSNLFI